MCDPLKIVFHEWVWMKAVLVFIIEMETLFRFKHFLNIKIGQLYVFWEIGQRITLFLNPTQKFFPPHKSNIGCMYVVDPGNRGKSRAWKSSPIFCPFVFFSFLLSSFFPQYILSSALFLHPSFPLPYIFLPHNIHILFLFIPYC